MIPEIPDHILFILIAIVLPSYSLYSWRVFQKQFAHRKPGTLRNAYIETLLIEWSLALALIFWWSYKSRMFKGLGLTLSLDFRTVSTIIFAMLGSVFFVRQWIEIRNLKGEIPESLKKQVEPVAELIPQTQLERKLFIAVALTAGFCEELLYRGFLLWYAGAYTNWAIAAVISILIFGFAHTYQGATGIMKTMLISVVPMGLYLWSGSLAGPILLHGVIDLTSGWIGSEVKSQSRKDAPST